MFLYIYNRDDIFRVRMKGDSNNFVVTYLM